MKIAKKSKNDLRKRGGGLRQEGQQKSEKERERERERETKRDEERERKICIYI